MKYEDLQLVNFFLHQALNLNQLAEVVNLNLKMIDQLSLISSSQRLLKL